MDNIYDVNGLTFRDEYDLEKRKMIEMHMEHGLKFHLSKENHGFSFHRCEAPMLIETENVSTSYNDDDYFTIENGLSLRPETTYGSYEYAQHIMDPHKKPKVQLPIVIWQHGKSFRNEQDSVTKNMRLKEFSQLEFQIMYRSDSGNDYYEGVVNCVYNLMENFFPNAVVVESDRLPDYSIKTMDIEVNGMELCSISKRKDFRPTISNHYVDCYVAEVAIGTDRCVYQLNNK